MIDTLKAAFVQGRLTKDELDERAGQTFTARTYAELAAVIADLPVRLAAAQSLSKHSRARARWPVNTSLKAAARGPGGIRACGTHRGTRRSPGREDGRQRTHEPVTRRRAWHAAGP